MHRNRNDDRNMDLQVEIRSNICLKSNSRHSVVEILNGRPATEAVSPQNKRSANGNVSETGFFELHTLFAILSKPLNEFSEKIADRLTDRALLPLPVSQNISHIPGLLVSLMHLHEKIAWRMSYCIANKPIHSKRQNRILITARSRKGRC